ncbi:hypothetical protein SO802_006668 [Lithocarpus litseifolius]|uniref:Uncharacterized protein n=1 Tax=Lithocarpus litseifolius TaxID=425828 RepID=A0AAW2DQS6_9ROSI
MQVVIMWWLKNHPFNHVAFINYGAEFSGIIKAGVVNNLSCDKVLQIRGPTKDLGPLDGTLAYSKLLVGPNLLTTTIPHLIPFVTKPGDSLQDMDRYNILGIGPNLNPQDISNCLWPSSECLVPFNGTGEVLGFLFTYILLLIIVLVSYVKFINCVDPFHEVKSKREKKKESKDIRDSRSRSANNTSNRGGRGSADRYVGHGGSSQFSSTGELEIDAVKCLSSLVTIDIVSAAGIYKFVAQQFVGFIRSDCKGGFCIFTLSCDTINAHKIQQCGFFLSSPTMSMPEALRAGSISTPQPTQTLPGAGVATGPALPQHLAVHPYSQPTLPLGHFANMISYPFLPQSYTYMPSAYQQGFAGNSTYHQSLAAMLPQYKNSVSVSSLPQSAAIPSGYAFGSSTSIPGGNFPLNPTAAPTGTTVGYDDVLSSQFKDSNHLISLQQNDNSAMWVHGPGSRTVSALPSTYYSFQGQNQQPSGYRQGQQPSQHFSYPNYYHSQTGGLSMEHQQQNPRDAASLGASQGQPPKQSQQIWQNSY